MNEHGLHVSMADPADSELDVFKSGEAEVDAHFRSRGWWNLQKSETSPPTYQVRTQEGGEVVGYLSMVRRRLPHPHDGSIDRAKYVVVYVVGIYEKFHGVLNPRSENETYAKSIFQFIEAWAQSDGSCVGISLWVRANNPRAIRFYRKLGFLEDPAGPVSRDSGAQHLTMRKLF
jgi:ribosomal protein S18 acetylase RimI-like enzyme